MKKIIFLLFLSVSLSAQEKVVVSLKNRKIDFRLSDFFVEKIIDARPNKDKLGVSFLDYDPADIILEKNLEEELSISLSNKSLHTPNKKPLIIKINSLYMTIRVNGFKHYAKTEACISFITYSHPDSLQEIFVANEARETEGRGESIEYITNSLSLAIENCINKCDSRLTDNLLRPHAISKEELDKPSDLKSFNCYKKPIKKRGQFYSFYDYRDQILDTLHFFNYSLEKTDTSKSLTQIYKVTMPSIELPIPWGFCDGEDTYVSIDAKYFLLYEKEDEILVDYASPMVKQSNQVPFTYYGGGVIGGLVSITLTLAANEIINQKAVKAYSTTPFKIDLIKGNTQQVDEKFFNKYTILNNCHSANFPLDVEINGKRARTIDSKEFFQREYTEKNQQLEICFIAKDGTKECVHIQKDGMDKKIIAYATLINKKLQTRVVVSPGERTQFDSLFSNPELFINRNIKKTHFQQDTTELIIAKNAKAFLEPTNILLNKSNVCAIAKDEYYKMKIILVEKDPNICFSDKHKRKTCIDLRDNLGKKAIVLLNEDNSSFTNTVISDERAVQRSIDLLTKNYKEKCASTENK